MKTYLEYLKEISADDLLEGLLGYGLFAEKIPGFLTAEQFYKFYLDQKKPVFKLKINTTFLHQKKTSYVFLKKR